MKKKDFVSKIQYFLDTKGKLVANSNPHFSRLNECSYDECFTYSLHCLESQSKTVAENINPNTSNLCSEQFVQANFEHFPFSQFDHNDPTINKNEDFKNYEGYFPFISNDLGGPPPISNIHSSSFNQTMDLIIGSYEDANSSDFEE